MHLDREYKIQLKSPDVSRMLGDSHPDWGFDNQPGIVRGRGNHTGLTNCDHEYDFPACQGSPPYLISNDNLHTAKATF